MNALLAFIPKPVLFWVAAALLAVSVVNHFRINNLQAENARYEVAVDQCAKTNRQNKDVVEFLKLQNTQCLDGRRSDETQHANAVVAWTVERELLKAKANEKGDDILEVYREPTCADLAQLNLTDACPGLVNGLRRRAENHNGIQNRND